MNATTYKINETIELKNGTYTIVSIVEDYSRTGVAGHLILKGQNGSLKTAQISTTGKAEVAFPIPSTAFVTDRGEEVAQITVESIL